MIYTHTHNVNPHSFTTARVAPSPLHQAYYRRAAGKQQLGDLDGAYEDLKLAAQMPLGHPGKPRMFRDPGGKTLGSWGI